MPALAEDEVKGLLSQVFLVALYCLVFYSLTFLTILIYFMAKLTFVTYPSLLFQGLHLFHWASLMQEEAQCMETEGLQKVEMAVAGLEAEGLYGILRVALSHSPMSTTQPPTKRHCQAPTATISKLHLQEPEEVKPKPSAPAAEGGILAQEAPSLVISQALEVAIPAHMTPLHLNVGGIKRVYKCWVEGSSKGPSTSWAAISRHVCWVHLGVRLGCPSCSQTFLNLDALRHHKKKIHTH